MFTNSYFPAHIEVLNGLLYSVRCERFKLNNALEYKNGPE
jgi:hypothetical protein